MRGKPALEWPADAVERRPLVSLIPYARNARLHGEAQVRAIADSIRQWGWTVPVLIDEDSRIIAGHGRVMAAELLGLDTVPCMVARGWTDAQRRAYVLADNQLTLLGGWDRDMLMLELGELSSLDVPLTLTGFSEDELAGYLKGLANEISEGVEAVAAAAGTGDPENEVGDEAGAPESETEEGDGAAFYSRKIIAPIYEPTGPCPPVSDLMDTSKTQELLARINAATLPPDVAAFLRAAAERHTAFHFARIAEFYAHAEAEVQRLMEESALVIIDFDQAIERGFVQLSKRLGALVARDYPEAA